MCSGVFTVYGGLSRVELDPASLKAPETQPTKPVLTYYMGLG
jgi:hypothetical protein